MTKIIFDLQIPAPIEMVFFKFIEERAAEKKSSDLMVEEEVSPDHYKITIKFWGYDIVHDKTITNVIKLQSATVTVTSVYSKYIYDVRFSKSEAGTNLVIRIDIEFYSLLQKILAPFSIRNIVERHKFSYVNTIKSFTHGNPGKVEVTAKVWNMPDWAAKILAASGILLLSVFYKMVLFSLRK